MAKKAENSNQIAISSLLEDLQLEPSVQSIGQIVSYSDGVIKAVGLDDVQSGELIDLGNKTLGLALNLEKNSLGIVVIGDSSGIGVGNVIRRTGRIMSIGVGDTILGRVVNSMGRVIDGKGGFAVDKYMNLEKVAPGVMTRQSVTVPLQTGIKAIDAMIPIGRGQRELIIGDRSTGKTAIALGTIINQHDQGVICVYVSVGQKRSSLAQTRQILEKNGAMNYTTIVAATASDSAAEQFLAPYAGQAIAEYFLDKGKDVLIVFDDLTKHAQAYREISLLLRRPSGREAYPGDVFYLHSRLLERACRLNQKHGGGSITALPVIETQANDVSAYIPTNVISITDGQIYLETDLFNAGMRPAINVGLSVSRVGSSAQIKAMKQVAGSMKLDLAQYRELQAFAQFSSDLDEQTKSQLDRGARVNEILKQGWDEPLSVVEQVMVIFAAVRGFIDGVSESNVKPWEKRFIDYIRATQQPLMESVLNDQKISEENESKISQAIQEFNRINQDLLNSTDES
ncbi:MAG: F0F1 ATP synthase subunit alpha [Patescibacteria group bacterium]